MLYHVITMFKVWSFMSKMVFGFKSFNFYHQSLFLVWKLLAFKPSYHFLNILHFSCKGLILSIKLKPFHLKCSVNVKASFSYHGIWNIAFLHRKVSFFVSKLPSLRLKLHPFLQFGIESLFIYLKVCIF